MLKLFPIRLLATIRKELLILLRDRGGLAILFLMPLFMIVIMALIQDAPFRDYQELKIPVLYCNRDTSTLGKAIEENLRRSKIFQLTTMDGSDAEVEQQIKSAAYDIGIVIPMGAGAKFNKRMQSFVMKALGNVTSSPASEDSSALRVLFAPDIKKSFKASVIGSIRQCTSALISQQMFRIFSAALGLSGSASAKDSAMQVPDFIPIREAHDPQSNANKLELNSVQHNVPAWTIFGMFFIVISLSGSIIKEREDSSYLRIRTMPSALAPFMAGKIIAYLMICLLQCFLMLLVGMFLLPLLGLPSLIVGTNITALIAVALSCGFAATGFGILIGTFFNSYQQSSMFGAISIVILAALGGIWVPIYVMPEFVRTLAGLSPLNWALSAFHAVFLMNAGIKIIWIQLSKLLLFFVFTTGFAYFYKLRKEQ